MSIHFPLSCYRRHCVILICIMALVVTACEPAAPNPCQPFVSPNTNYLLKLNTVQVVQVRESNGDRPYFNTITFSSQLLRTGSTHVELHSHEPNDWVSKPELNRGVLGGRDHMQVGDQLPVPWWMAWHEWRNVSLVDRPVGGSEIFGAIVVTFDNNNTPPHMVREVLGQIANNLRQVLQEEIEQGRIVEGGINLNDPAQLSAKLASFKERITRTSQSNFDWAVSSTLNPDRVTGVNLLIFPAIRNLGMSTTTTGTNPVMNVLFASPGNFNTTLDYQGEGAHYVSSSQLVSTTLQNELITSLSLAVHIGGDNIDGGSNLSAVLSTAHGGETVVSLNQGQSIGNHDDVMANFSVPSGTCLGDIRSIALRWRPHDGCPTFCDNVDIDVAAVEFSSPTQHAVLTVQHGAPLMRLTNDQREFQLPISIP